MKSNTYLAQLVAAQHRGQAMGIYAICSANRFALEAGMQQALKDDSPLLVESTSNQVNQEGGYTGMTPADFWAYLGGLAAKFNFPRQRLILGGDHLGPNAWQHEPAASAMGKGCVLARDCVRAGYTKIHLDASMTCADDPPPPLPPAMSASRAADLCAAAESAYAEMGSNLPAPEYVIGTEVPAPGGVRGEKEETLAVTTVAAAQETIELTRSAFEKRGLEAAWERVIAVVVQPGVEYGDASLFEYNRAAAADLSRFIEAYPLVYEAHSTDYQPRAALRQMVDDHFAILKVGPAVTFAFREAVFALALMETEWLAGRPGVELSNIRQTLDQAMLANPVYWQKYYPGGTAEQLFARQYSFSDRSRYYWPNPAVDQALTRLLDNLRQHPVPLTLLSQFMPAQYERVRAGVLPNAPTALIYDEIGGLLADYAAACGYNSL